MPFIFVNRLTLMITQESQCPEVWTGRTWILILESVKMILKDIYNNFTIDTLHLIIQIINQIPIYNLNILFLNVIGSQEIILFCSILLVIILLLA